MTSLALKLSVDTVARWRDMLILDDGILTWQAVYCALNILLYAGVRVVSRQTPVVPLTTGLLWITATSQSYLPLKLNRMFAASHQQVN